MARNEDGEFELMLGNKQLLSVFFLMVLLLCLCFVGGYLLGRSAAPVLSAANESTSQPITATTSSTPPPVVDPTPSTVTTPAPEPETAKAEPPPIRTAPQVSTEKAEPAKPAPIKTAPVKSVEVAKATPPPPATKAAAPAAKASGGSQPIPGRVYLQLSATDKDKADVMVDLLRSKKLPGIAAMIPENPRMYRVLVGPMSESAINDMKSQLKAGGFPGDQAIKRVF